MSRYTLAELLAKPTITQGQTDDLKVFFLGRQTKVWLSRMTKEDGQPYDNQVTIERFDGSAWVIIDQYPALDTNPAA
jgi:hypothetical protein